VSRPTAIEGADCSTRPGRRAAGNCIGFRMLQCDSKGVRQSCPLSERAPAEGTKRKPFACDAPSSARYDRGIHVPSTWYVGCSGFTS
jgi:hypothetical protein